MKVTIMLLVLLLSGCQHADEETLCPHYGLYCHQEMLND